MRIYVFNLTFCYFGVNKIREVEVKASSLDSAWNKIVKSITVKSSLLDIRYLYYTDEK